MKRRLLIVCGALALLVLLLLVAVRLPATQTWLARRAVAGVPGVEIAFEQVSAGLSGAELRDVVVSADGARVRLPLVRASYEGWAFLARREVIVRDLTANDIDVELAPTASAQAAANDPVATAKQAFGGLLAPLQLPVWATVESVQLSGRVRVSATQAAKFSAQGRLLVPGQEAATDLHLEWSDSGPEAVARQLDWVGRLTIAAAAEGAIERLKLDGTLAVPKTAGGRTEQGVAVQLTASRDPKTGAENVEAVVRLSTAKEKDQPLAKLTLAYAAGVERVAGTWSVNARREQFEGIVDIERLPEFAAEAQGNFGLAVASGDFAADGRAAVTMARLQRVRRELGPLGTLVGKLEFALEQKGDALSVERLELAVNDARGPVLKVAALQPVEYKTANNAVAFARPDQDLARVEINNLPLAWAQPWLEGATLGGTIASGEVRVRGAGAAWTAETARPLAFSGLRFASGGQTFADQLAGELKLKAGIDGAAWSVEQLELALRGVAAGAPATITTQVMARQDAEGRGRAAVPLTLEMGGRRSELKLEGEWSLAGAAKEASARVSGKTIYLRDLVGLAALLPKSEAPAATTTATAAAKSKAGAAAAPKDAQAFWSGFNGRATIDVQRLVLESEEVTGLQASVVCEPQKLALERFTARAKNAPLEASFGVTFDAAKAVPYVLEGRCAFPGFDLGAWLRAANPGEEPAIESVLDVNAKLAGQGTNLDSLLAGVRGEFVLKGGPGVLRIKDKRVETASALGGLVLGLLSKDKQQKPAVVAGSQLLEELREFRFESIDASLLRAEDLNLQFRTIDVRSVEKRLTGSGTARHVAGGSIADYPLQLELRLAGKENFGVLLDKAGLLGGTKDELGYVTMREAFTVTGTVGEPNWKAMLAKLATGLVIGK
ncbi:MAG: hypothetical protein QM691_06015 [Opitutaceae bacterium]